MHRDTLSGLLLVGFSVWIWWLSASFPQLEDGYPGPSLFPQIIAGMLAISGVYIGIRRSKKTSSDTHKKTLGLPGISSIFRLIAGVTLAASYPLLIQYTHFIPVMTLLILFFGLLLKNAAWHSLFMAILSASLIYGLFTQLLNVPL